MQTYNWIKAYYTTQDCYDEREVFVRQEAGKSDTFIDKYGTRFHIFDLDFTRSDGDHKAKIGEREYWRKLRGDIALEIIRKRGDKEHYKTPSHFVTIADATRVLFNELYEQDQEFFKDK